MGRTQFAQPFRMNTESLSLIPIGLPWLPNFLNLTPPRQSLMMSNRFNATNVFNGGTKLAIPSAPYSINNAQPMSPTVQDKSNKKSYRRHVQMIFGNTSNPRTSAKPCEIDEKNGTSVPNAGVERLGKRASTSSRIPAVRMIPTGVQKET